MPSKGLKRVLFPISVDGGVDAGNDPKVNGGWIKMENARYTRRGSVDKRLGFNITSNGGLGSVNSTRMSSSGSATVLYGGDDVHVVDPSGTGSSATIDSSRHWVTKLTRRNASGVVQIEDLIPLGATTLLPPTPVEYMEIGTNFEAIAYGTLEDSDYITLYLEIRDVDTGALLSKTQLDTDNNSRIPCVRLVTVGSTHQVYYTKHNATDDGKIFRRRIFTDGSVLSESEVVNNVDTTNADGVRWFDACVVENSGGNPHVVLAYWRSTTDVRVVTIESGTETPGTTDIVTGTAAFFTTGVCCFARDDTHVDVAWVEVVGGSNRIQAGSIDVTDDSTYLTPAVIKSETTASGRGKWYTMTGIGQNSDEANATTLYAMAHDDSAASADLRIRTDAFPLIDSDPNMSTSASTYNLFDVVVTGKPIEISATEWVFCGLHRHYYHESVPSGAEEPFVSQHLFYVAGEAGVRPTIIGKTSGFNAVVSGPGSGQSNRWGLPFSISKDPFSFSGQESSDQLITRAEIQRTTDGQAVDVNDVLYAPSANPLVIDSSGVFDAGFISYPAFLDSATTTVGGGIADGTYSWVCTYRYTDSAGNIHRSIPTVDALTLTLSGGPTKVTVTAQSLDVTSADIGDIRVELWRRTGSGPFHYVKSVQNVSGLATRTVDIVDNTAVATVEANELLYTVGGYLSNLGPGPHTAACLWKGRYVYASDESPNTDIFYSQEISRYTRVEHNTALKIRVPNEGGPIRALAALDDKLVIFKKYSMYVTAGEPATPVGSGSTIEEPRILSSGVGTDDPRTVVRVPQGLMFASADQGIFLVGRDLQVTPVGDPVRYYTDDEQPTCAAVLPSETQALFVTGTRILAYDWLRSAWTTYTIPPSPSSLVDVTAPSSDGSKTYYLGDVGNTYLKHAFYNDESIHYGMKLETGWISLANYGGSATLDEILIIGQVPEDVTVRVKVAYNFDPAWDDNQTFDTTTLENFDFDEYYGDGLVLATYQHKAMVLRVYPKNHLDVTSFRLQISDEKDVGFSEGISISQVAVVASLMPRNAFSPGVTRDF